MKSRAILQAELAYQSALAVSHSAQRALAAAADECCRVGGGTPDTWTLQYWVDQEKIARGKALAIQAELDKLVEPSELWLFASRGAADSPICERISLSQIIELCRDAIKAPQP